jgi:hypothetical protein
MHIRRHLMDRDIRDIQCMIAMPTPLQRRHMSHRRCISRRVEQAKSSLINMLQKPGPRELHLMSRESLHLRLRDNQGLIRIVSFQEPDRVEEKCCVCVGLVQAFGGVQGRALKNRRWSNGVRVSMIGLPNWERMILRRFVQLVHVWPL